MPRTRKVAQLVGATELPASVRERIRPPVAVVLGAPAEVAALLEGLGAPEAVCYQMDLFPAERLREELGRRGLTARVETAPDLWDLPADFRTVLYPTVRHDERELKIDMVEQSFHILRPRGSLVVWSRYEVDQFFPGLLKKVFGRVHAPAVGGDAVFWCQRDGDRPRRRHEVAFQCRVGGGPSSRFVSRPGVFSYGRFDDGARALCETMEIRPGDRVLDLGCGVGTNGTFAAQQSGLEGVSAFVDSNVRAVALAETNARANGLVQFTTHATCRVEGLVGATFDVVLANPPYFAQSAIAQLFIARGHDLLRPGGRFYLVTRQPEEVGEVVAEVFGRAEGVQRRGYIVFAAEVEG